MPELYRYWAFEARSAQDAYQIVSAACQKNGYAVQSAPWNKRLWCASRSKPNETSHDGPKSGPEKRPENRKIARDLTALCLEVGKGAVCQVQTLHRARWRFGLPGRPRLNRAQDVAAAGQSLEKFGGHSLGGKRPKGWRDAFARFDSGRM